METDASSSFTSFIPSILFAFDLFEKGLGDWTVVVNPNVMASETGSSSVVNGMNSSGNGGGSGSGGVGGMTSRFGYFWTNQAALSITLVLGTFFLVVNLILFAAIYRRQQQCRRKHRQDDKDKDNTIQVRNHCCHRIVISTLLI